MFKAYYKIKYMIELEYPFKIFKYKKNRVAVGIVEFSKEPHSFQNLKDKVSDVVLSFGDCEERGYGVRTDVKQPEISSLSTKVTPVEAELDKKEVDIILGYNIHTFFKKVEDVCKRMTEEKKDNAMIVQANYLLLFHGLKNAFNPESTGNFLKATKRVLLEGSGQICKSIKSEITPSYLEVDVEVETPYELSI